MSVFDRKSAGQFLRFLLVGVLNTVVDLLITRLLQLGFGHLTNLVLLTYYIPKVVGYACGILNSYFWNSSWTFRAERKHDAREIGLFLAVNLVTLGLSLLLMFLFRDVLGWDAWWNGVMAGLNLPGWIGSTLDGAFFCTGLSSGIALIINFIGNKLLVFAKRN